MNRLWTYKDYVKHLSNKNSLVRRWAFDAVKTQYPDKYCDEISTLLKDENSYLARGSVEYLAKHNAVENASKILDIFKTGEGLLSSSCARALAKMNYEPALEDIIGSLSSNINSDAMFGIFEYLGKIQNRYSRKTLISAATQIRDPLLKGCALLNLLRHGNAQNAEKIIRTVVESIKEGDSVQEIELQSLAGFWDADIYLNDITGYSGNKNLIENPGKSLERFFKINSHISIRRDQFGMMVKTIDEAKYHDLLTSLMFEIQNIVKHRYADEEGVKEAGELFLQDTLAVELLRELARHPSLWRDLEREKYSGMDILIAFIISLYCTVLERGLYVKALSPHAGLKELIAAVKNGGAGLPEAVCRKTAVLASVPELKNALSDELDTWGDIWMVRIMGQIRSPEFLPDLIKVINSSDIIAFINEDAVKSIRALCGSDGDAVLKAIQNDEISDWDMLTLLEHLPFSESFDLVSLKWDDTENRMDSYESAARCLSAIGDKRGIKKLQEIYAAGFQEGYIGDSLECLATLHNVTIPELNDIYKRREEEKKRQKTKADEFDKMMNDIGNTGNQDNIIPFKREHPKIGRNEPCPCGSGKKYKKCCLNKA